MLSDAQIERYSRQIILPQLGGKGQEKFLQSRILVNGSGTRQAITLLYLAAAGVGTIGVIGAQMQTEAPLFSALRADQTVIAHQDRLPDGQPSDADVSGVVETLTRLNPDCQVLVHPGGETPEPLVADYDLVISEPDPLLDACFAFQRPFVCSWGQAAAGCLFVWNGDETGPCFHCLPAELREQDNTKSEHVGEHVGQPEQIKKGEQILASVAGIDTLAELFFGAFQTTEALKCLIKLGASAHGKVFECQFPDLRWSEHVIQKDPTCVQCGQSGGQSE